MSQSSESVDTLIGGVRRLLGRLDAPEVAPFRALLSDWGAERIDLPPAPLPVLAYLDAMRERTTPETAEVTNALVDLKDRLNWRVTYSADDVMGAEFLKKYGWTELIGKAGPCVSDRLRLGFVAWAPRVGYPPHAHAPEELYVVLSGTGEWTRGDEAARLRPPGSIILHESQMWHSTWTLDEPVLALYMWRGGGDLLEKPHFKN